jgi:hypothetical protein
MPRKGQWAKYTDEQRERSRAKSVVRSREWRKAMAALRAEAKLRLAAEQQASNVTASEPVIADKVTSNDCRS